MDCHDAKDRIFERRETAAVRRHLGKCGDCADYARELDAGGRDLARAFLAEGPRPDFGSRVAARISEEEISAVPRPAGLLVRLVAVLLFLGTVAAGWLVFRPSDVPPSSPAEPRDVAVTPARREHPLRLAAARGRSDGETLVSLGFAGRNWTVPLAGDVEAEVIRAWGLGARRVELLVTEEVPFPEVTRILVVLERAGFAYDLSRPKS